MNSFHGTIKKNVIGRQIESSMAAIVMQINGQKNGFHVEYQIVGQPMKVHD